MLNRPQALFLQGKEDAQSPFAEERVLLTPERCREKRQQEIVWWVSRPHSGLSRACSVFALFEPIVNIPPHQADSKSSLSHLQPFVLQVAIFLSLGK